MGYGLSHRTSAELVAKWSPDYIRQKIRLVEELRRRNPQAVRNVPGFIRQAIAEDYQPNQKSSSATPTNRASRYRRVTGSGVPSQALSGKNNYSYQPERANLTITSKEVPSEVNVLEVSQREAKSYNAAQCGVLWERVCTALDERYRRPDLTAKLVKAHLEIAPNEDRATVRLARPWLANSLLLADRALLQMAFSQEIGPGYCLEIVAD
jgi:hypothetical protein